MSKYIIRYLLRTRDQQGAQNVMFDAWQRRHHPYDLIDIIAVWSDADVAVRSKQKKGAAA